MEQAQQDQIWFEGLQNGDCIIFDQIYQFYRPRIFSFLARLSGRRDRAEDLLQETFLRLAQHGPSLKPETRLGPWLYTVARNLFVSSFRRQRLEGGRLSDFGSGEPAGEWISPFDLTSASQTEKMLERGLSALPPALREVLLLIGVEKLDQKEAAQVLGISHQACRQRLSRARTLLSDVMGRLEKKEG